MSVASDGRFEVRRESFLFLAIAISGCHDAPALKAVTIEATSSSPQLPVLDCAAIARNNDEVLAKPAIEGVEGAQKRNVHNVGSLRAEIARAAHDQPLLGHCRTGHGAWFVEIVSAIVAGPIGESEMCGVRVEYTIGFQSAAGARVSAPPRTWESGSESRAKLEAPFQVDIDGDGNDELFVKTTAWQAGFGETSSAEVLKAAPIGPYPVGFHYNDIVDADHDGIPDLLDGAYYRAVDVAANAPTRACSCMECAAERSR